MTSQVDDVKLVEIVEHDFVDNSEFEREQAVDVLITVDAKGIVADDSIRKSKDYKSPIDLTPQQATAYLYMTATLGNRVNYAGAISDIKAFTNNSLRWRETTLSLGAEFYAVMYSYTYKEGDRVFDRDPRGDLYTIAGIIPNNDQPVNPDKVGFQTMKDYHWNAIPKDTGNCSYNFCFGIYTWNQQKQQMEVVSYYRYVQGFKIGLG